MPLEQWIRYVRQREPGQKTVVIDHPGGWTIIPVHYSMFDACDDAWRREQRRLYTTDEGKDDQDWNQEMEIDFSRVSGVRIYHAFTWGKNTRDKLPYDRMRPLMLCVDFNVAIMAWPVVQEIQGLYCVIDEVSGTQKEATIPKQIARFRERYPAHPGGVEVYGDATGRNRGLTAGEHRSCYDLIELSMRDYASKVTFQVPLANPPPRLRTDSVNMALSGVEAEPVLLIHRENCHYLLADMLEAVWHPNGHKELQVTDQEDPKHMLTHASAALGYMIAQNRPVSELARLLEKRQKRKRKDIDMHRVPICLGKL